MMTCAISSPTSHKNNNYDDDKARPSISSPRRHWRDASHRTSAARVNPTMRCPKSNSRDRDPCRQRQPLQDRPASESHADFQGGRRSTIQNHGQESQDPQPERIHSWLRSPPPTGGGGRSELG